MGSFFVDLDSAFEQAGDADCLRLSDGQVHSYRDLQTYVNGVADVLLRHEVHPGDRVLVQVDKSAENLWLYLATLKIGAVYVPLNTAYTPAELDYFIEDAEPALYVGRENHSKIRTLTLLGDGSGSLMDEVVAGAEVPIEHRERDDLAAIVYTSGTTGRSKGAMLSHENLRSNALSLGEAWGWQANDVLLHALPIFHVHGLFIATHCALLSGTPMVWLPRFDAGEVQRHLQDCTVMMGVPTFYTRLLDDSSFPHQPLDKFRVFICGSAPLTPQVFAAWENRTGHRILERYGMSETIINTTNPLNGERVAGTVGYALPRLEVRIASSEGEVLPRGEVGGIEVRGPNVFSGYWRNPQKTAEEIRADGYFITGDLGVQDEDGRVSIVGRSKDLVISGGYNVYPKEVEKLLDSMPEIVESAVIGVPHADFGEAVVAVVVPKSDAVELNAVEATLQGQLARFKQPKAIINVPELPRNTMGKVQKNVLRELHSELFAD